MDGTKRKLVGNFFYAKGENEQRRKKESYCENEIQSNQIHRTSHSQCHLDLEQPRLVFLSCTDCHLSSCLLPLLITPHKLEPGADDDDPTNPLKPNPAAATIPIPSSSSSSSSPLPLTTRPPRPPPFPALFLLPRPLEAHVDCRLWGTDGDAELPGEIITSESADDELRWWSPPSP